MKRIVPIFLFLLAVGAVMVFTGAYATISQAPMVKADGLSKPGVAVTQGAGCPVGVQKSETAVSGCSATQNALAASGCSATKNAPAASGCTTGAEKAALASHAVSDTKGNTLAMAKSCCAAEGKEAASGTRTAALKTSSN